MSQLEFTQYFTQFNALLYSFAYSLTKDEDEAQDLLQETAYKAFKYRGMYQPQTNLRAWLMTIMRNTFINNYRQKKRRQTINDKTDNNFLIDSGSLSVRNQGETNLTFEEILQAIEDLEEWARIPFIMHYQGFKYDEIAEKLEVPLGTVKSRIFFARKRLQSSIRGLYNSKSLEELLD
jgi:RNA polymerase sigma-70 factor (ECF subfamily)